MVGFPSYRGGGPGWFGAAVGCADGGRLIGPGGACAVAKQGNIIPAVLKIVVSNIARLNVNFILPPDADLFSRRPTSGRERPSLRMRGYQLEMPLRLPPYRYRKARRRGSLLRSYCSKYCFKNATVA